MRTVCAATLGPKSASKLFCTLQQADTHFGLSRSGLAAVGFINENLEGGSGTLMATLLPSWQHSLKPNNSGFIR